MLNMFMSQCFKNLLYFSAMSYQPNNQNISSWLGVGPLTMQWFCYTPRRLVWMWGRYRPGQRLWALYQVQQAWGVSHHSKPVKYWCIQVLHLRWRVPLLMYFPCEWICSVWRISGYYDAISVFQNSLNLLRLLWTLYISTVHFGTY